LYIYTGETIKAEQGYNEISKYILDLKDNNLSAVLDLMDLFSAVKERYGDYERAEEIRTKALELYQKSNQSKESSRYLSLLLGVAKDKLRNRSDEEANKILIECSKIAKTKKSDLNYLQYLILLAQYKEFIGSVSAAKELYSEATMISKKKSYIVYSENLTQEAFFYFRQKDYQTSFSKYLLSWQVLQKQGISLFPIKHVDLTNFSLACYATDKIDKAKSVMFSVDSMFKDEINKSFLMLTQTEKESFVFKTGKTFKKSNSLYLALNDSSLNGTIYDNVLAVKSIALLSNQYLNKTLSQTGNEELKVEYDKINHEKIKYEGLVLSQTPEEKMIFTSKDSIALAERNFMNKIRNIGLLNGFRVDDVKWKDIQGSLNEDEAAIEIVNFPLNPCLEENNKYYALLINKSVSIPLLIPLFEESMVTKLFQKNLGIKSTINSLYSGSSITSLYEQIWAPLKPHLGGIKKVYLSLSGILHLLSFPALTKNESQDVVILSSTRVLVDKTIEIKEKNRTALLYGDITYITNEKTDTSINIKTKTSISSLNRAINRITINKLPDTRVEIENISKILELNKIVPEIFTKEIATEKSFRKSSSSKPEIIHLSTHGFYYPVEYSPIIRENIFGVGNDYNPINNPMNRSGLLFEYSGL
jgi:CHAT domain-containing protein